MKRKLQILTICCFLSFLAFFSVLHMVIPDKNFSPNENRILEKMPSLTISSLISGKFMSQFSDYMQDQFPFRDVWISIKAASELALNKKVNNGVYITDNGLIAQFTEADRLQIQKNINKINMFAENTEKPVWFMIIPTAAGIYPEFLPENNLEINQKELLKKIESDLTEKVGFIPVYEELMLHKDENLYFKTDHHWTMRGAFYGYQAFCQAKGAAEKSLDEYERKIVSEYFRGTSYSSSGAFWYKGDTVEVFYKPSFTGVTMIADDQQYESMFVEENLERKDQYTYFLDGNHALTVLNSFEGEGNLLIIKDSYGHDFAPYLTEDYKKIILVDLRYYKMPVSELIKEEEIDEILILYNLENFASDTNLVFLE